MRKIDLITAHNKFRHKTKSQRAFCLNVFAGQYDPYMKLMNNWMKSPDFQTFDDNTDILFVDFLKFLLTKETYPVGERYYNHALSRDDVSHVYFLDASHSKDHKESKKFFSENFADIQIYLKAINEPTIVEILNFLPNSYLSTDNLKAICPALSALDKKTTFNLGEVLALIDKVRPLTDEDITLVCMNGKIFDRIFSNKLFTKLCQDASFNNNPAPLQHILDRVRDLLLLKDVNAVQICSIIDLEIGDSIRRYSDVSKHLSRP